MRRGLRGLGGGGESGGGEDDDDGNDDDDDDDDNDLSERSDVSDASRSEGVDVLA
jgi:hypothetical protein